METTTASLQPPAGPFTLGNTAYLSQETTLERQALYSQLVNSYKWVDKVHDYSQLAVQVLAANALKRSHLNNSNKRRRPITSSHNVPPQ